MSFIADFIKNWKHRREREAAAKRKIMACFAEFIEETRPLAPKATKHPEAALYRHAWKRAVVLADIAAKSNDTEAVEEYEQFQQLAGRKYYAVAPDGPYGKIRLELSSSARLELTENEKEHIAAKKERAASSSLGHVRGVVYLLKSGSNYKIGQTIKLDKRLKQVKLLLPDPVTVEHKILTNDPAELERLWHRRFASKRKGGEWFELDDKDVADFRSHSEMWIR